MEITRNQIDDLNLKLSIKLEKEDYFDKYENALKRYRKQVNMPGFRPGKVPMSLIKKQYGPSILAEELNSVLNDKLYEHIVSEKLEVLGNPIPVEGDDPQGDWSNPSDFTFEYEMGLAPELNIEKALKKAPVRYKVKIDKKLLDKQVDDLTKRHGEVSDAEVSEENDLLLGTFIQLDDKGEILEGGIMNDGSVSLEFIEDKKTKKALTGVKKDDEIEVDPHKVSRDHDDLGRLLGITHEQVHDLKGNFKLRINEVKRLTPAELNQELFDKVFGEGTVSNEEEFRNKLSEELEKMFDRDADNAYKRSLSKHILDNLDAPLPDEFLKRWIRLSNEKPITPEQVEEEYADYSNYLRWQLVEGKIARDNKLQVETEEIREQAKAMLSTQYAQYGMPLDENLLNTFADNMLQDQKEAKRIHDVLLENKVLDTIMADMKIKDKEVSYDDFLEKMKD